MASKSKRARAVKQRNLAKDFMYWAIAVFVIKLIIIGNVQGGAWLGADGENYLTGYDALVRDGVFSKESLLNYWPAGYPLFIWFLSLIGKSFVLTTLAVVQSAIFSFSVYFFATQLAKTGLKKFAYLAFLMILFNPTLSLSSIAVGYESLAASGFLISVALIIKDLLVKDDKKFMPNLLTVSIISGLLVFIQPRFIISVVLTNLFWIFIRKPLKAASLAVSISIVITLLFPATLVYRNSVSVGLNTISTNGSAAFNMGAGDGASGGYDVNSKGVPCTIVSTDLTKVENEKIICVLKWYAQNPVSGLKLFFNKSKYLWSPWFGPEANGTMARNPWLKINPIKDIASTPDGLKLVLGSFGKIVSWSWILLGLFFMFTGAWKMFRSGSIEKSISIFASIVIAANWLVVLLTIGDHRFRLPIMGLSLFLQAVGIQNILLRKKITNS
jgi:hypothetical protein